MIIENHDERELLTKLADAAFKHFGYQAKPLIDQLETVTKLSETLKKEDEKSVVSKPEKKTKGVR